MKKILKIPFLAAWLLSLCLLLSACAPPSPGQETEAQPTLENLILLYLCGSDLESDYGAATRNLRELLSAPMPEGTQVVVQTGGTRAWRDLGISSSGLSRYRVENGELVLLEALPGVSMGAAGTLEAFLLYGIRHFPAEHNALILWDHGGGGLRGVCFDEKFSYDSLTLTELREALTPAVKRLGRPFDLIGFDACLMAGMETAFALQDYAEHMIASEELEPSGGWDYSSLPTLLAEQDYDGILRAYGDKCTHRNHEAYTLSHLDFSGFPALEEAFCRLTGTLSETEALRQAAKNAEAAIGFGSNSEAEGYTDLIDLGDFADAFPDPAVRSALQACVSAVNGRAREKAGGLSFYFPLHHREETISSYLSLPVSPGYADFIRKNYTDIPEETIFFTDPGSSRDGELHIALTPESMPYVHSVRYKLYRFRQKQEFNDTVYLLGYDSTVEPDGQYGFTTSFGGLWASWNGQLLSCSAIDRHGSLSLFSTPVERNGTPGTVRFYYDLQNRTFTIQGFLPKGKGHTAPRLEPLRPEDTVTLMLDDRTDAFEENLVPGTTFLYQESAGISLQKLPPGYVQLYVVVTDIFGREYRGSTAVAEWDGSAMRITSISDDQVDS